MEHLAKQQARSDEMRDSICFRLHPKQAAAYHAGEGDLTPLPLEMSCPWAGSGGLVPRVDPAGGTVEYPGMGSGDYHKFPPSRTIHA